MTIPTVDLSSDLIMVLGLIGFLTPFVISVLVQVTWPSRLKSAVLFLWCLVIGFAVALFSGKFNGATVITCTLITFTFAIAFYAGLWKQLGITDKIERATSIKPKDNEG